MAFTFAHFHVSDARQVQALPSLIQDFSVNIIVCHRYSLTILGTESNETFKPI